MSFGRPFCYVHSLSLDVWDGESICRCKEGSRGHMCVARSLVSMAGS